VPDEALEYAVSIVRATRPHESSHDFIKSYISWGAGPRASQNLVLAGKARAALRGVPNATQEDVRAVAPAVLRHRLVTNFNADAEGVSTDTVISRLLEAVPAEPVARR
jgi:MoxR-like ATPase